MDRNGLNIEKMNGDRILKGAKYNLRGGNSLKMPRISWSEMETDYILELLGWLKGCMCAWL